MVTTTITSPVTVTTDDATKYASLLADLQANPVLTNVVGNASTKTITFDYSTTITE